MLCDDHDCYDGLVFIHQNLRITIFLMNYFSTDSSGSIESDLRFRENEGQIRESDRQVREPDLRFRLTKSRFL